MVSYFGGMFGEFTCTQISGDTNFYPVALKKIDNNNRYHIDNPITAHFSNLKTFSLAPDVGTISQEDLSHINKKLLEKNLCFPSHIYSENLDFRINLPKLKTVRMFTEHDNILMLGFCCQWIKSLLDIYNLQSKNNRFVQEFESYIKTQEQKKFYEKIKARGKFYWFEKIALKHQHTNLNSFIDYWWVWYRNYNKRRYSGWHHIDIGSCFVDYHSTKDQWKEYFGLADYLNKESLDRYHLANLELVDRTFEMPFNRLTHAKCIDLIKEWVKMRSDTVLEID